MIAPDLPAFLDGKNQPKDNDERLALLGICQFTNRTRSAANLYAGAFAAAPHLAEDLGASHRYKAACAAALAGCDLGENGARLSQDERTRLAQAGTRLAGTRPCCLGQEIGHRARGGS